LTPGELASLLYIGAEREAESEHSDPQRPPADHQRAIRGTRASSEEPMAPMTPAEKHDHHRG
jgi:hypothetical protein